MSDATTATKTTPQTTKPTRPSTPPRPSNGRARQAAQPIGGEWCVGILGKVDDEGGDGNGHSSGNKDRHPASQRLTVRSGDVIFAATRAASCLLEPAAGDSVACLRIAPDEVWVMAVLRREEGVPNVLRSPGGLRVDVAGGALELQAARIGLKTDHLDAVTKQMTVATDSADVVGRELTVVGTKIKLVGSWLSSVMDRVQHVSQHYLRTTDGMDRVVATHVECEAKQLLRLEGEHTLVNGRALIKARGAQIHFG